MEKVETTTAPAALGPYSQAVITNGFVFVSGQLPINPVTGEIDGENAKSQANQVLMNIENILSACGSNLGKVVKSALYITDIDEFGEINQVYSRYFSEGVLPARVCIEVSKLPKNAMIEMNVIAEL